MSDIDETINKVFNKKKVGDVVKAVAYDRGQVTNKGETRHLTLVAMVVASDSPIASKEHSEIILMGDCAGLVRDLNSLEKYKCPYKLGAISSAIINVSQMTPQDLEKIENIY